MFYTSNNIKADFLAEELFHAYQDAYYPGGIEQYTKGDMKGRSNIEFESKLMWDLSASGGCCQAILPNVNPDPTLKQNIIHQEYYNWLEDLTNQFTTLPTNFTEANWKKYYKFMEAFVKYSPKEYKDGEIDYNLKPQVLFLFGKETNKNCKN